MKTTQIQFMNWAVECQGYGKVEAHELGEEYNFNLFDLLDESYHEEVKNFIK